MFNVITAAVDAVGVAARRTVADLPGGSASFRVQPDRVFELANRFEQVADKIQSRVAAEVAALWVEPPGADKPSVEAAGRLTDTGFADAGLVTRLEAYAKELRAAAASLRQAGSQYRLTDRTEGGRLGAANG